MIPTEGTKLAGTFSVPPGMNVYGELTLSGDKSTLYLQDQGVFDPLSVAGGCVGGALNDLTKVTLVRCIPLTGLGSANRGAERYHFATLFPHFVVFGSDHFVPTEQSIAEVHFTLDDATTLFYDFDAFGSVINASPLIETVVKANALPRQIEIGPHPQIFYFTGKMEIISVDTVFGKVSVSHRPSSSLGGPSGVGVRNTIFVSVAPHDPITFDEAFSRANTLLRYLGMLVGRKQNLLSLSVRTKHLQDPPFPPFLQVYSAMSPKKTPDEEQKPHVADILMDAVRSPEEFSRVLAGWLNRQEQWGDARFRFFGSFGKQNQYDPDRLVASANMFDVLPASAVPPDVPLSDELKAARDLSVKAFSKLPESPERDSVLSALGRIGKCSLKRKVRHRAQYVTAAVPRRFPDLLLVTDQAVNCRNFYVHGNETAIDYATNPDLLPFFVDVLEFVFAASDLIEAGWNLAAWCAHDSTLSHPFARFRIDYARRLRGLKTVLASN
jgi:hypothetical protein